jgi:oligoendopeptidase F
MQDTALGILPEWDLSDLYPAPDSAELAADLDAAATRAQAFNKRYQGKVADLDGDGLATAIADYEGLQEMLGRILSFAYLTYAGDMADEKVRTFFQSTQERANDISSGLLFLGLEINRLPEEHIEALFQAERLAHYRPWIRDLRVLRPYQLSDDLERLLHEKEVAGRNAWVRLFDETMAGLRFDVDGEDLTSEQTLHFLSDKDGARRKAAAGALAVVFKEKADLFALITNTLAKDKEIEDKWRGMPSPDLGRHLSNHVETEVVDALVDAVRQSYPRLSHRYYALKAGWFGVDQLHYWDRNAPLPEDDDRRIGWDEAQSTVLAAYRAFSGDLGQIAEKFFDNKWIDAAARPGKAPGAFAHPTVPSAHPYLLLNYQGKPRDVMTLAHELGHGVHQVLAGQQGPLMADTPLTLAETASVFGEMLTFRSLLDSTDDPNRRRLMLASKVEDMLNTVVRQISFFCFERHVHTERRNGEVPVDRLGQIWLDTQSESLGPAIRLADDYRHFWCYIPHFIHAPFYVYAYAFGDCLVNALYAAFQDIGSEFQPKYLAMLRAGGTLRHDALLAPFGLDARDPAFWSRGLGVVEGFIDELEAM